MLVRMRSNDCQHCSDKTWLAMLGWRREVGEDGQDPDGLVRRLTQSQILQEQTLKKLELWMWVLEAL